MGLKKKETDYGKMKKKKNKGTIIFYMHGTGPYCGCNHDVPLTCTNTSLKKNRDALID